MLELLAPAGSMEALTAAVQNGADAVYMGFGDFNARRNAKNFTEADFASAVSYCHLRGVKVYLTLNTLLTDRELPAAADLARRASDLGADAVLVQDLGVLRAVKQAMVLWRNPPVVHYQGRALRVVGRVGTQYTLVETGGTGIAPGDVVTTDADVFFPNAHHRYV